MVSMRKVTESELIDMRNDIERQDIIFDRIIMWNAILTYTMILIVIGLAYWSFR
jgi:hypothetical protein